jgi:adenylyltransferase/sulfurtransferase
MFGFTEAQIRRYSRQIILPHVGGEGQRRLLQSRVVVIGAGGLGSPAALYLAGAGVGTLGVVESDTVELSNLHRQILHSTPDVGRPKTESAADAIHALNPDVCVTLHHERLTSENALEILGPYDVVVEGSDNFPTKYQVNDACVFLRKPLVLGAVYQFEGQASVFLPDQGPCYRCIFPEPPPPEAVPSCQEAGVMGVVPGLIGCIQATEAIKLLLGAGNTLVGRFLVYDALHMDFTELRMERDPTCPACGDQSAVAELIEDEFPGGLGRASEEASCAPL